jgi:hypothetical protein
VHTIKFAKTFGVLSITLSESVAISMDTGSETHKKILEKAFNRQFQDPNNKRGRFLRCLNKKICDLGSTVYSTIFQSSEHGKSRLIKEIANNLHSSLRSKKYWVTSLGADLFEQVKEREEWKILYILQTAIHCFKKELKKCEDKSDERSVCERVWRDILNKLANWITMK